MSTLKCCAPNEEDVDDFLGVKITKPDDGSITMTQSSLIERILQDVGLEKTSKKHNNPALQQLLLKHESSQPAPYEGWKYRSVLGKLAYLSKNTRPDIEYVLHQCARSHSNPRKSHHYAIKRICRYLLRTRDKRITCMPYVNLTNIKAYMDADLCGSYKK